MSKRELSNDHGPEVPDKQYERLRENRVVIRNKENNSLGATYNYPYYETLIAIYNDGERVEINMPKAQTEEMHRQQERVIMEFMTNKGGIDAVEKWLKEAGYKKHKETEIHEWL